MPDSAQVLLAFDFGEKRIGVASGNTLTGKAQPLAIVAEASTDSRFSRIELLIREWQPARLVVGRPLHPDGTAHDVTARAERFARQLEGRFSLPVALVDERYSSVAAQERMREAAAGLHGMGFGDDESGYGADDASYPADRRRPGKRRAAAGGRRGSGGGRGQAAQSDDAMAAAIILEQYLSETQA